MGHDRYRARFGGLVCIRFSSFGSEIPQRWETLPIKFGFCNLYSHNSIEAKVMILTDSAARNSSESKRILNLILLYFMYLLDSQ